MKDNTFINEKTYRVCDSFIRRHISSIDYGKSKSTLRIQNNQPYSFGLVKVSIDAEETQKISFCPSECSEPGEIDSLFTEFFQNQKFRKRFIDLSDRRRRDRIKLGSCVILKLCSAIDDAKDIKDKKMLQMM